MNKKNSATILMIALFSAITGLRAQTVSTFENLTLPVDTFWNGSDFSGGFSSGNAYFPNTYNYDSLYGGYWASGFAYATMRDSLTAGFQNLYSSRAGSGYNSVTYAIGQNGAVLRLQGNAAGKAVYGFYVTNTTYAALSMRDGDFFSKKFGGISGNDPDWFRLSIIAWDGCCQKNDTVHVYLADYRFADNSQDYILKSWQWVDLLPLGDLDSLQFLLTSTDNDSIFGMNTPPFFCIDNFTTADSWAGVRDDRALSVLVYPNPATEYLHVYLPESNSTVKTEYVIFSSEGRAVMASETDRQNFILKTGTFSPGIYTLLLYGGSYRSSVNFIVR